MKKKQFQRGGTLVEAAVTLPVLFLFLFAILEFGRASNLYHVATNAAREGARYAVTPSPGTSTLPSAGQVQSDVAIFLGAANATGATVSVVPTTVTVNGIVTDETVVTVAVPYTFLFFPFGTITMSGQARMRNETN
jgi:Flp pilus assembly protein TadG